MNASEIFSPAFIEAINSPVPRLSYAVRIGYDIPLLAHTGVGEIIINNEVYYGLGQLGKISTIEDDNTTSPSNLELSVTGLDPTLVNEVLTKRNNNKSVKIFWVVFDENEVVVDAVLLFSGKTTEHVYNYDRSNVSISVKVADRLVDWSRKASNRYTDESHKSDPNSIGDRFFRYVTQMAERPIYWGNNKDAAGFRYQK